jgi:hypothetical protein
MARLDYESWVKYVSRIKVWNKEKPPKKKKVFPKPKPEPTSIVPKPPKPPKPPVPQLYARSWAHTFPLCPPESIWVPDGFIPGRCVPEPKGGPGHIKPGPNVSWHTD